MVDRLRRELVSRRAARSVETGCASDTFLEDLRHHAVIIGYGPVGQSVTRLLKQNGIQPTVVELNLNTVKRLRALGIPAIYGDATHVDTLKSAGVGTAGSLILSASGTRGSEEVIRIARELNAYFSELFRRGALMGRSSPEAFYVKCDAETNPPEVRDLGQVVAEIGLAPAVPGEFIVVRLIQGAAGVTIAEPA